MFAVFTAYTSFMKSNARDAVSSWKILPIGTGSEGALWHWEQHSESAVLIKRSAGFREYGECLDDAINNGYLAAALS